MMETYHNPSHEKLHLTYIPAGAYEVIVYPDRMISPTNPPLQGNAADPWKIFTANPVNVFELKEYYEKLPRLVDCTIESNQENRKHRFLCSLSDPFERLPYEILIRIFIFLPFESIVPFRIASHPANIPIPNQFWRWRIQNDMPWLWDLFDSAAMTKTSRYVIDWRKVYISLKACSDDFFHDHIPGLINRQRIWNVCNQLAVLYISKISPQKPPKSGCENVCEEVRRRTVGSLIPPDSMTGDIKPDHFNTFMLMHIGDLRRSLTCFSTHWNKNRRLVGISMTMTGCSRRLFGHENSDPKLMKSLILEKGDWIDYLIVGFKNSKISSLKVWMQNLILLIFEIVTSTILKLVGIDLQPS